ncbi:MAG: hypothetical protein LBL34_01565 [Clostridiales bacterium]|jgi:hypothetical protein|nr:hypothetical protein [Clostridiales bacterium]
MERTSDFGKIVGYAELAMAGLTCFEPPEGFETLEEKALFGNVDLTRIALPSTFKHWGHDCVGACDNLREVYLHEECTRDIVERVRQSVSGNVAVYWGGKKIPAFPSGTQSA